MDMTLLKDMVTDLGQSHRMEGGRNHREARAGKREGIRKVL